MLVGTVVIVISAGTLWVTAPRWEPAVGWGPAPAAPEQFVYVNVTDWTFAGPPGCWEGTVFSVGITVPLGGSLNVSVNLPSPANSTGPSCLASTVRASTAGFVLQTTNAPLSVGPGDTGRLVAELRAPGAAYSGPLGLSVEVSSA
jgi:hypothetical protein